MSKDLLSRFEADLFTRNLHFAGSFWEEHRLNVKELFSKVMSQENLVRICENAARLCLTFNEQAKWIPAEYNRSSLLTGLQKFRDEVEKDKEFAWKFMDAYLNILVDQLSSIENKTSARNAKDLANSPELQSILSFFATRESIIVEKHKSVLDLGKMLLGDAFETSSFIKCFLPPLMLFWLRFFDIYDSALQGMTVDAFLNKLKGINTPKQPSSEEEAIKKAIGEKMLSKFGQREFWEHRYTGINPDFSPYDWYVSWELIRDKVISKAKLDQLKDARFLQLGCGNSIIAEEMLQDNELKVKHILSIDFVESVIGAQEQRISERDLDDKLEYDCVDATKMKYSPNSFDMVFCKGMLDSVMATANATQNFEEVMSRVSSSLKIGGHFVVVSGAITIEKIGVFANPAWNLKVTHLSELASEKNEEQKINLIIIEKVGATATATTSTTDTPATQDATTTPTN